MIPVPQRLHTTFPPLNPYLFPLHLCSSDLSLWLWTHLAVSPSCIGLPMADVIGFSFSPIAPSYSSVPVPSSPAVPEP